MSAPSVGSPAPGFDLQATGGRRWALEDLLGSWSILAFYPGDFTAICTKQFCAYRDGRERLERLGATVLGISTQDVLSHEAFARKYELTIPLLSDPGGKVARAYGCVGIGGFVRRSIFILDPENVIRHRHVALLGLTFRDVNALGESLRQAQGAV